MTLKQQEDKKEEKTRRERNKEERGAACKSGKEMPAGTTVNTGINTREKPREGRRRGGRERDTMAAGGEERNPTETQTIGRESRK